MDPMNDYGRYLELISGIRAERDTERRLLMLKELNRILPSEIRLELPSLITNAYVRRALDIIQERLLISA